MIRVKDVGCLDLEGMQSDRVSKSGLMKREEMVKALHKMKCYEGLEWMVLQFNFLRKG